MSKMRILFLGTPEFAVVSLERLLADHDHYEVVAVVTQPDRPAGRKMWPKPSPVKKLAMANGLAVLTPETVNTAAFREQIALLKPESAVVVAFGQILGQKFLDLFPKGCVNVHGSLLPRWRGAAPMQRAIMAGDVETGVALQVVVRRLDAGPILGVRRLEITDDMDAIALHDRLKVLGADLLHLEYMDYLRGNLAPVPQDESKATFAAKIEKAEAHVNWSGAAREIFNKIRGLAMGPAPYVRREGQALKLHKARVVDESSRRGQPGEVVAVGPSSFQVACSQGVLEVLEVQPESRSRQAVADYLRGYPLRPGDRFQ